MLLHIIVKVDKNKLDKYHLQSINTFCLLCKYIYIKISRSSEKELICTDQRFVRFELRDILSLKRQITFD